MLKFKVKDGVKIAHGTKVFSGGGTHEAENSFVTGWVNSGIAELVDSKSASKSSAKKTTKR